MSEAAGSEEFDEPALLRPSVRRRHEHPVQERVMEAATRLFAEHGYERTSVAAIAKAAGVTKGAMYHYISSKDDVLYAIYYRVLIMQTEHLAAAIHRDAPVEERLREACIDVVETNVAEFDVTTIFLRSMHQLQPSHYRAIQRLRRSYHDMVESLITEGQKSGVFRSDIDPSMIVAFYFGAVHHMATWFNPGGKSSANDVGTDFSELLLSALMEHATDSAST